MGQQYPVRGILAFQRGDQRFGSPRLAHRNGMHPDQRLFGRKGIAAEGAALFVEKGCNACHGDNAKGGRNMALVGNPPIDRIEAPKTIANFWANATTLYDTIRRSMPWPTPRTLSDSEVYALVAYLLAENKIIAATDEMNAQTLPKVKMPNRDNFIIRFPDRI